jgi:hypothetical protein
VLESESVLDIHHYSLLYKPCWPSKPSACAQADHTSKGESIFFTVLPLPSPEKVCVASCSLEAFWFCYSVLKSLEKIYKKTNNKKKKRNKKEAKSKRQHRRGFVCIFLFFCAVVLCDYLDVQAHVSSTV